MSELTQPVHLFIGDEYMRGKRPAADAGVYNADDNERPIFRMIGGGGTVDTAFVRPATILDNEWSLEHVLAQIANPGATFTPRETPVKIKVTHDGHGFSSLLASGTLYADIGTAMDRVAVEPMFADRAPELLFLINGNGAFAAAAAETVRWALRPRGRIERDGFSIHIVPSFASADARNDTVLTVGTGYSVQLSNILGQSALIVKSGGASDTSAGFTHSAGQELRLIVDWRLRRADVVDILTGAVLASTALTHGDWTGREEVDAVFGIFDGDISAPQARPIYATPRCDLIVLQMASALGSVDGEQEAETLINAIGGFRSRPWGSGAPVWLILPPETISTPGDMLGAREAMLRAAAELESVSVFETRHLARSVIDGSLALTGTSIVDLAEQLSPDAQVLFTDRRRTMARARRTGYRHFATADSANAFIEEMLEAGVATRQLNPMLGGGGVRSGDGVAVPWQVVQTERKAGDVQTDPNTGEALVVIDQTALDAGFTAAPSDGCRIVPATTGTRAPSATSPQLEKPELLRWQDDTNVTSVSTALRAQLFDPVVRRIEKTNGFISLALPQAFGLVAFVAGADASIDSITEADPTGNANAVRASDIGVTTAQIESSAIAVTAGVGQWVTAWFPFDAGADTFPALLVNVGSLLGVAVDPATGRTSTVGAVDVAYSAIVRGWVFVAFRFTPAVASVTLVVQPARGHVASWPTEDPAAQGSVTVWGANMLAVGGLGEGESLSNPTPYGYHQQVRVLRARHLLCEDTRVNFNPDGVAIDTANWTASGVTLTRLDEPAPDGSPYAWELEDASLSATGALVSTGLLLGASTYTLSAFFKKDNVLVRFPELRISDGTNAAGAHVNTNTGEVSLTASSMTDVAARADAVVDDDGVEWWRVQVTFTIGALAACHMELRPASGTVFGTVNAATVGACTVALVQLESGAFASTFVPTFAGAKTRAADGHRFVSAAVDADFYGVGFELDYWPEHDGGQAGTVRLLEFSGVANVGLRLVADADAAYVQFENGAGLANGTAFEFSRWDRITINVTFDDRIKVYLNKMLVDTIDIAGHGTWAAYSANTALVGANAFGAISQLRASA